MPFSPPDCRLSSRALQSWFSISARPLPWRLHRTPYTAWLSEVILQQTRVNQGLPYYNAFIERYPDIRALAAATEQEVLRLWQGLGYYSRARNIMATAEWVVKNLAGQMPNDYNTLIQLPGIGPYIAAAVSSMTGGEARAVLDGNVYRVVSRFFADPLPINAPGAARHYQQLAAEWLDKKNPGLHNEALMELGALICVPGAPKCPECPVSKWCRAFRTGTTSEFPVKLPKKAVQERRINYAVCRGQDGSLLMRQRTAKDIWQGLYDFPELEMPPPEANLLFQMKHQLTHRLLLIYFYEADIAPDAPQVRRVSKDELPLLPMPKPIADFLLNTYI